MNIAKGKKNKRFDGWSAEKKKRHKEDADHMKTVLVGLYVQGSITKDRLREIYSAYKNGEDIRVRGVEYYAPTTFARKKKYSDLTDEEKQDYIKWVKREVKNGDMDWDIGQEYIDMIKNKEWNFNVTVVEYITGDISDLSDEEHKRVQDTLNTLATEYAEDELNKTYKQYTSAEQDTTDTVYVTPSGKKYHRINCQHVRNKKCTAIPRSKAVKKYSPCSKCRP